LEGPLRCLLIAFGDIALAALAQAQSDDKT